MLLVYNNICNKQRESKKEREREKIHSLLFLARTNISGSDIVENKMWVEVVGTIGKLS